MKTLIRILICTACIFPQDVDSLAEKSSGKAALYSAIFPGAGQVYNGKWLKSALIVSLEAVSVYLWQLNGDIYKNFETGNYELPKRRYLEKRNKYTWWAVFFYVYGIIDAVIDAHLTQFDNVMSENIELTETNESNE